jgi:hydroxyacylglutathione hydrolase
MRRIKQLFVFLLVIAVLAGIAAVVLRVGRSNVGDTLTIRPNLVAVTNAGGVYVYATKVGGGRVLFFDTGLDPDGHPLDAALGALGAGRDAVSDVFLTHAHPDHVGGAGQLAKAKLHLGAGDVALAEGKADPEALVARLFNLVVKPPPVSINAPIDGAAAIDVGDGKVVKAFPVPGHTPGSYAFFYDGVLFVGDIMVFKQGQLEPPPRAFDPHPEQNRAAIRSLKTQLGSETVDTVCTGHGGCTPRGLGKNLLEELISRLG